MTDREFSALLDIAPLNQNIQKYLITTRNKLKEYSRIAISYSGGSDSDIVLDIVELVKPPECGEILYVFFDTGLEWDATIRHVKETEQKYGVEIHTLKPKVSIPAACAKYGIPFISKDVSDKLGRLQRHKFDWNDTAEQSTTEKYGDCKSSLDWYFDRRGKSKKSGKKLLGISELKLLKNFIQQFSPTFKLSKLCCKYSKKDVAKQMVKIYNPNLQINGMRQAEGGTRAGSIKNCFSQNPNKSYSEYRPLWFWTDEDKRIYKEWRNITYSDCYEIWGFERTGCVGCPCSSDCVKQLEVAKQYEPNKVKAAYAVFGKSYEYRAKYNKFKREGNQLNLFED